MSERGAENMEIQSVEMHKRQIGVIRFGVRALQLRAEEVGQSAFVLV